MKHPRTLIAIMLVAGLPLAGCAFGERQADLKYPPPAEDGTVIASAHAAMPAAGNGKTVVIGKFDDLRPEKNVVGHVLNGFGMETAEVVSANDVGSWVGNALKWELEKAGYRVVREGDATSGGSDVSVSGKIIRIYCRAYFQYQGEVTLRATLLRNGAEQQRTYFGKANGGLNMAATGESYARALSLALQDGLRQVVADIRNGR